MPGMRFQPIIVPGWKNSGPGHWQTYWAQRLPNAVTVQQEDWENPSPASWVAALSAVVSGARCPPLLIAHSLGCLTVASLPVALRPRVAGALLVAPPDLHRPGAPPELAAFGPPPDRSLPFPSVVVASTDDPYCGLERAERYASSWGSRFVVLENAGHINADSGLGQWEQGLKLLAALRRRAVWRVAPPPGRIAPVATHRPAERAI